jgi:hypothetical protein
MLAMFTRLTSGEEMPGRERTRLVRGSTRCARRLCQRLGLRGVAALLWLAIAVALISVAVGFSGAGGGKSNGACTTSWPVVCASRSASAPLDRTLFYLMFATS